MSSAYNLLTSASNNPPRSARLVNPESLYPSKIKHVSRKSLSNHQMISGAVATRIPNAFVQSGGSSSIGSSYS